MSPSLRHSLTAYAFLFAIVGIVWVMVLGPLWSAYHSVGQQQASLHREITRLQQSKTLQANRFAELERQLQSLSADGRVLLATPDEAAHYLQSTLKLILAKHSIAVKRLQPDRTLSSAGASLYESSLEIGFEAPFGAIQRVLEDIAAARIEMGLQLLSLRNTRISNRPSGNVEGRLIVTLLGIQSGEEIALNSDQTLSQPSPSKQSKTPNYLYALFDPIARSRFLSPTTLDYRVAAITRSEQGSIAVIVDELTGQSFRLIEGDFLHAWMITAIQESSISLRAGSLNDELRLTQ